MPSAASFGAAFRLARGNEIAEGFSVVRRSIGHEAIQPNRVYRYPIQVTIADPTLGKRKRDEAGNGAAEKVVQAWFSEIAGEAKKRMVWTFYGNPYDIWIENEFQVQRKATNRIIVTAVGHGIRNFAAPKKPPTLIAAKKTDSTPPTAEATAASAPKKPDSTPSVSPTLIVAKKTDSTPPAEAEATSAEKAPTLSAPKPPVASVSENLLAAATVEALK